MGGSVRYRRLLLLAVASLCLRFAELPLFGVATQTVPRQNAVVFGQVRNGLDNRPIAGAAVYLSADQSQFLPGAASSATVLSDQDGWFLFREVLPSAYQIRARAPGFLAGGYGSSWATPILQTIELSPNQFLSGVMIRLEPEAVISGTVRDRWNNPVARATVSIARRVDFETSVDLVNVGGQLTDDQGHYRLSELEPGQYVLFVPSVSTTLPFSTADIFLNPTSAPRDVQARNELNRLLTSSGIPPNLTQRRALIGETVVLLPDVMDRSFVGDGSIATGQRTTFLPQSSFSGARVLTVEPGTVLSEQDISLSHSTMVSVAGRIDGPGGPEPNTAVFLIPAEIPEVTSWLRFITAATVTGRNGTFEFAWVPPGDYRIKAWRSRPPSSTSVQDPSSQTVDIWGVGKLSVGTQSIKDFHIQTSAGIQINGAFRFDGTLQPTPEQIGRLRVQFQSLSGQQWPGSPATTVEPTGEFRTGGYPADSYLLMEPDPPSGWFFESAVSRTSNVWQSPIDIAGVGPEIIISFTDRPSLLVGAVRDSSGRPDTSSVVLVVPANYRRLPSSVVNGLIRRASVRQNGAYSLTIPPGTYVVNAVPRTALSVTLSSAAISRLMSAGKPVTVERRTQSTVDITRK